MQSYLKRFFWLSILAVIIYSYVGKCEDEEDEDSDVVVLTDDNFDEFMKKNPVVLVEFYAPWCGHCKRLAPEYKTAATALKGKVPLGKVDATIEKDLASKHDVRGYPTLKLFRDGKPEEYGGGRTSDLIVEWVTRMTGPAYTEVDSIDDAKKMHEEVAVVYVGHFKAKDSEPFKHFVAAASSNRHLGKFASVVSDTAADEVIVLRKNEDPVSHTASELEALVEFINKEFFPLFGPISAETYGNYAKRDLEFVWWASDEDDYKKAGPIIRDLAKTHRDAYSFVWLDTSQFGQHAQNALAISEFPGLVIQSKKGRFIFPSKEVFNKDRLSEFFVDVTEGKIAATIKSEPKPEKNDAPVRIIVGNSFKEEVIDSDKDVMVEVYAPWCGHCQKLAPIYEELAESVKHLDHIVISKMDGVENESPVEGFDWSGFPTIYFVKAGESKPTMYDGARTLEGLQSFIQKHASKEVDFKKASKEKEKEKVKDKEDKTEEGRHEEL